MIAGHAPERALLIADLHLDASRADTLKAALDTFAAAANMDALWILGDLFEAWIGDDAGLADPFGRRVAHALLALAGSGTEVHVMLGNRDFLLGDAFATAAGATLHREDECIVTLAGEPVLLMHGDTLCSDDVDYQRMRRQLRDPAWQAGFTALPVEQRLQLAKQLRGASQQAGGSKTPDIMDVTPATVRARLHHACSGHGVRTLVHGHTHRPAVHALLPHVGASAQAGAPGDVPARRWVLGDWQADGGQAILADADGLRPVHCPGGIRLPCPGSGPAPLR